MATRSTGQPESPESSIAAVVPGGDLRKSLIAIRNRLADETDHVKWAKHRRECVCQCGMADIRALVALTKRLEETLAAIAALPEEAKGSAVDNVIAAAAKRRDELAARRTSRDAGAKTS